MPSANHTARWELVCLKCGTKKSTTSANIRRGLEGSIGKRLAGCKCGCLDGDVPLRHDGVRELFNMKTEELRLLLAVLACEKFCGYSPTRLEIVKRIRAHASTTHLIRNGWVRAIGFPMRIVSTPKAWRELGFSR